MSVFDVCVVGSGPGGGIAAYALAKAGLKVVLLEAGGSLRAGIDYGQHAMPWEVTDQLASGEFVLNTAFGRRERNHFTPVGDRPEHGWLKAVGGRSLCWAGHTLRFGPGDFHQWPISYDDVAPYYSRAERYMGVYGNKDGLWNLPDGEYFGPIGMRCGEWLLRRGVERLKTSGARMELVEQRKAMLTEDHPSGRALCHFCGKCNGCCVDAKYTSANTPIPQGLRTGNLTLTSEAMMTRIVMDGTGRRVSGVEYTRPSGAVERVDCRALVLACNSIETPRHLLLNRTRQFPNGLANSSGQVGRNLTSHFGLSVVGYFPELRNRAHMNDESAGTYQSLLTGLYWDKPNPKFEGTYQVQNTAGWSLYDLPVRNVRGFGRNFKRELREKCAGSARMNMQGSLLISSRKFVDLDPERKDRYGLNVSRIHLHYEDSDVAMAQDMVEKCEEIIKAGGGEVTATPGKVTTAKLEIDFNHWVGTARMGNDPKTSVLDRFGRSHDVPNLFIGDASVFSAYPEKNPTLTNIALSWRMSDHLVELARKGGIVMIERRELFKIITVGALVSPAAAQSHNHASAPQAATKHPPFFNAAQQAVLDRLGDIIIPSDDQSPGAHEAGVVRYLDLLAAASAPVRREQWLHGIETVEAAAGARFSHGFSECAREQQEEIVAAMAASEGAPRNDLERFFELLKHAVVDGYRFSEIGVRQYMGWTGNQFETKRWNGACTHPEHGAVL